MTCEVSLAQDYTPWFPFQESCAFTYTMFNKKDKETGSVLYKVSDILYEGDTIIAVVVAEIRDKKKKYEYTYDFTVACINGNYIAEFTNYINPTMNEAFGSAPVITSGDKFVMPNVLSVGMSLPDVTRHVNVSGMNARMDFTNREVSSEEQIDIPIGSVLTYKILGQESIHILTINRVSQMSYYYAEGYGLVKSELLDKRGDLEAYMLMTSFSCNDSK